jgi:hypothetical protein
VNLGSISNSHRTDRCATYVILHVDPGHHRIEHRVVDYDRSIVLDQIHAVQHPAAGYLRRFFVN